MVSANTKGSTDPHLQVNPSVPKWKAFQGGPNSEMLSAKVGNILILMFKVKGMAQI